MSETNNPSGAGSPELWLYDGDSATDPYLRSLDTAYAPEEGSVFVSQAAYDAMSQQLAAIEAQRDALLAALVQCRAVLVTARAEVSDHGKQVIDRRIETANAAIAAAKGGAQ